MPITASGRACERESFWTSRDELEMLFGQSAVFQWADVENTRDPRYVARKIDWAVRTSTDDARNRLRGSVSGEIDTPGPMLRMMTTALAGVQLYTAKGVKDTSSDEGRFRLSWARKKADDWFDDVVAGKIELLEALESAPVSYPFSIAPLSPSSDGIGVLLTPEQHLERNQQREVRGIMNGADSGWSAWWNGFDTSVPGSLI